MKRYFKHNKAGTLFEAEDNILVNCYNCGTQLSQVYNCPGKLNCFKDSKNINICWGPELKAGTFREITEGEFFLKLL